MPPEVYGAIALALKHAKSARREMFFPRRRRKRLIARHRNKAQKLLRRAERLSGNGERFVLCP